MVKNYVVYCQFDASVVISDDTVADEDQSVGIADPEVLTLRPLRLHRGNVIYCQLLQRPVQCFVPDNDLFHAPACRHAMVQIERRRRLFRFADHNSANSQHRSGAVPDLPAKLPQTTVRTLLSGHDNPIPGRDLIA